MRLLKLAAALVATLLLAASPGFGHSRHGEAWMETSLRACTPEVQRCLEKLEERLRFHGRIHDWLEIENALHEVYETDPECALLLRGLNLHGL